MATAISASLTTVSGRNNSHRRRTHCSTATGAFASYKLIKIIPRQHAVIFALSAGYYEFLEKWDMDIAVQ